MPATIPIDRGLVWSLASLDHLRFMRATYVRHSFKPHAHDYFVLGLLESGVQTFQHGRQQRVTVPGNLIVINPGEVHTGEAAIADGFAYRALYPSVPLMAQIAREFGVDSAAPPRFDAGLVGDVRLYRRLRYWHARSEIAASALELDEALTACLVALLDRHVLRGKRLPTYHHAPNAVQTVRDYLEAHYADKVTLAQLASLVHLSPYHLARLFRKQIGIPPHKYLENVRVRHAERLLMAGQSVADVAYATGFSSQSHLTRTFKRFIGTTPAQFAQQRKIV